MKKAKLKVLAMLILMLMGIMQLTSLAASKELITIEKDADNYIIYIKEVLTREFEYAFSDTEDATNLIYMNSGKDSQGNSVVYVDETAKSQFFTNDNAFLWVKVNDTKILDGISVSLKSAKSDSQLQSISNITKTITVKSEANDEKISINGNKDGRYFYKIVSVNTSKDYQRLVELVEKISNYNADTNIYTKMQSYAELNELYTKLAPTLDDGKWVEAKNLEIEKPYGAKENQQYILWLKDENGTRDFQILTAYQKTVKTTEVKEKIVKTTSTLPVTYDNTFILYIALGVVLIAIIAMVVIKKITSKNSKE